MKGKNKNQSVAASAANTNPQSQTAGKTMKNKKPKLQRSEATPKRERKVKSVNRGAANSRSKFQALVSGTWPPPDNDEPMDTVTSLTYKLRRRLKVLEESPFSGQTKPVAINDPDTLDGSCRCYLEGIREKLAHSYHTKPLRDLVQFDALITRKPVAGIEYNSSGTTDKDGDCVNRERKFELRTTGDETVRIQVPVGITPSEAVRVLRKTAKWITDHPDLLAAGEERKS